MRVVENNFYNRLILALGTVGILVTAGSIIFIACIEDVCKFPPAHRANVQYHDSVPVFICSRPVNQFYHMGWLFVKGGIAQSPQSEHALKEMILQLKKTFGRVDGIIFWNMRMDSAQVITFEESRQIK